jgi:serine/threonine protein kinase
MLEQDDRVGKQIGNYYVEKILSNAGGFGIVYLGKHVILGRPAVIKLLRTNLTSSRQKEQFLQEARFLETLKHRYILPILDAGIQDEVPYLVTEYAPYGSLSDRLREQHRSPLRIADALIILSQIGQALHFAHQHNVLHRDLKPGNILFNAKNEALLADFGIALKLDTAKTQSVDMVGTPAYMAPEQFASKVSPKSDQYALGCIAYELFTGRKAFSIPPNADQQMFAWIYQHATAIPVPPTQLNPNLPANIEQAILKALAKNRDDRHVDVSAFLAASGIQLADSTTSNGPEEPVRTSTLEGENDSSTEPHHMLQEWLVEGDRHYQTGRYEEALAAYEQALRINARSVRAMCARGSALEQLKRYAEASAAYEQAISLDSTYAYAHLGKGNISFVYKRYKEALTDYKIAVRLDPRLAIGYEMLGRTLTELKRNEEAIAAYEAAIQHNPAPVDNYYRLADLHMRLARLAQAIEVYDRLIRIKPDMFGAYFKKVELLKKMNRPDEAIATCNQLIGLDPHALEAYQKKIALLKQLKHLEEAIATCDQCIAFNPAFIDAHSDKAQLLEQLKHSEEAIAVYDEIIRLKPDMIDTYRKKIVLLEQLKRYEEMLRIYDQIIDFAPNSLDLYQNRTYFDVYRQKAILLEEMKRFTKAIETYEQMISRTSAIHLINEWKEKIKKLNKTKLSYRLVPLLFCLLALSPIVNIIVIAMLFQSLALLGELFLGAIVLAFIIFISSAYQPASSTEDGIGYAAAGIAILCSLSWGYVVGRLTSSFLIALLVVLAIFLVNGFAVSGFELIMTSPKLSKKKTKFSLLETE